MSRDRLIQIGQWTFTRARHPQTGEYLSDAYGVIIPGVPDEAEITLSEFRFPDEDTAYAFFSIVTDFDEAKALELMTSDRPEFPEPERPALSPVPDDGQTG